MKLKITLAVLAGVLVGLSIGFYATQWTFGSVVAVFASSHAEDRLGRNTILLKLLDEGKIDVAKSVLLSSVQGDTLIAASSSGSGSTRENERLFHFARISGNLPSVRADTSEVGVMAAKARATLPSDTVAADAKTH